MPHEAASASPQVELIRGGRVCPENGLAQEKRTPFVRGVCWRKVKTIQEALSHAPSPVHRQDDLGDGVDSMREDTIKLLNDDDGRPKRGALCGSHKTVVPNCVNVWFSLLLDVTVMVPLTGPDRGWW